jgi:ketosteroid isomerase-like protein
MDMIGIRQAIEAANSKFGEAVRKGDGAAIAALYSEKAKLLPPGSEMIQGGAGIQAFWSGAIKMGVRDAVLTTEEVLGMGDLVCEVGKYDLTIKPEGGQGTAKDIGKYLVVWKEPSEGDWKILVDIWNTSQSAK